MSKNGTNSKIKACYFYTEDPCKKALPENICMCGFHKEEHTTNWALYKVGDLAKCKKLVDFMDGTFHKVGETYDVTKDNCSYFNVCQIDYEKV